MSQMQSIEVLAFAPHPDDAELFCGGILAKLALLGYRTGIIDLTQGELGSQGSVEIRAAESANAASVLNLTFRKNLGLPDGGLAVKEEQIIRIVEILRLTRPEIVLAPYWDDRHPDHSVASELVTRAVYFSALKKYASQLSAKAHTPRQTLYYQLRRQFTPSFVVDITGVFDKKVEAINCYQSQIIRENVTNDKSSQTLISSPFSVSSISARDEVYGAMIGVKYAEPFFIRNMIMLNDPLNHFRQYQTDSALILPNVK